MIMENRENTGEIQRINGKFAPGVSGNPAGKPKGVKHFTTIVQEALKKLGTTETGEKIELEKALGEKVVAMALDGNEQMIKLIWNYRDGLPKAVIELDDTRKDETKDMLREMINKMNGDK